jgi:TolB-like protein/Flp pilus assembly protein TadD
MKSYQQLFAELKRRKVFRVAAVYGAVAFGLIQVADPLAGVLDLPETFLPFVVGLLLLGFPLALVLAWAFEVTPDGVQRTERALPDELAGIIAGSARERWPAPLLGLLGLVALLAGAWWAGIRMAGREAGSANASNVRPDSLQLAFAEASDDDRPSIAVLPFLDMSPQGNQQYFSDGMTEEILNTLAKIHEIKVAARTSAFAFRGRDLDMRAIGDSLGVHYLIEGSVRKAGDQLRITAQLIDSSDGSHVWSESYDRRMDDVFAIQTEIAGAVAKQLRVPLGLEDPNQLVTPTEDLEVYDLYLAARGRMRQRGPSLREARHLFEAAISRDSSWAPAWAGLAEVAELSQWYPGSWEEERSEPGARLALRRALMATAVTAAERALSLDSTLASAHVALGSVFRNRRRWDRSESEYRSALALDPDNAEAYQQYAEMLLGMGRIAEARIAARRAVMLDHAPIRVMVYGIAVMGDGQLEAATRIFQRAIRLDPENQLQVIRRLYREVRLAVGDYEHALPDPRPDWLTEAVRDSVLRAFRAGDPELMPAVYLENEESFRMYAALERPDLGLDVLEREVREWPENNYEGIWAPPYDAVRARPGFRRVLALLNLDDATPRRTPRAQLPPEPELEIP